MNLHEKIKKLAVAGVSDWVEQTRKELAHSSAKKKSRKIALLVLERLDAIGMTQLQLANKLGVSRQQVSKIVQGGENLTLQTISKLEEVLNISLLQIKVGLDRIKQSEAYTITAMYEKVRLNSDSIQIGAAATSHFQSNCYTSGLISRQNFQTGIEVYDLMSHGKSLSNWLFDEQVPAKVIHVPVGRKGLLWDYNTTDKRG